MIGLTGGIGSGKSTVSGMLAQLGAVVIDADKVGHEALKTDLELKDKIISTFGRDILAPDGEVDRRKLAQKVFGDRGALNLLNRIMHPKMYQMVKSYLQELRKKGVEVVVLEAPLLFEAGWDKLVDEVWVTVASRETILKRLKERSQLSKEEALARIGSQLSSEERKRRAKVVINTDCHFDELRARVEELWKQLKEI